MCGIARNDSLPIGHPEVFGKEDVMENNNMFTEYRCKEAA
jgi:hypothetical protein